MDTDTIWRKLNKTIERFLEPIGNRLSNPLTGSFIIALIAINWKLILYLFLSPRNIEGSFDYINGNIYNENNPEWKMVVFYPMLIAVIYAYLVPMFTEWMELFVQDFKNASQQRKQYLLENELKHHVKVAELNSEKEFAKSRFNTTQKLNEKIKDLTVHLDNNQEILVNLENEKTRLLAELSNEKAISAKHYEEKAVSKTELSNMKNDLKALIDKYIASIRKNNNSGARLLYDGIKEFSSNDTQFISEILNDINENLFKKFSVNIWLGKSEIGPDAFSNVLLKLYPGSSLITIPLDGQVHGTLNVPVDFTENDVLNSIREYGPFSSIEINDNSY